jgi:hypothetical protein
MESQETFNTNIDYEILLEDFTYFDLAFKLIVIGNSGKKYLYIIIIYKYIKHI